MDEAFSEASLCWLLEAIFLLSFCSLFANLLDPV